MSVKKRDRQTSKAQFIKTARDLEAYTVRLCVSQIPKRYSFYIGQPLVKLATDIYNHTIMEILGSIDMNRMEEWMGMIKSEIDLIKGVMNSDRERAKKLPE